MGRNWTHVQTLIDSDLLATDAKALLQRWHALRTAPIGDKEHEQLATKPLFCTYRGERFRCVDIALSGFVSLIRVHNSISDEIDVLVIPELCTDWGTRER